MSLPPPKMVWIRPLPGAQAVAVADDVAEGVADGVRVDDPDCEATTAEASNQYHPDTGTSLMDRTLSVQSSSIVAPK